ncbi:CHAD domain-containing protein [Mucilaginibacter sp. OK098]|uniref:CHAD domain-containing protein n=1 Tax=Mucilaginibacter sp. OK098 TaxID=1855297 RepID=UPI00090ED11C|nr:CHAD domain-containing protein [Mucilaginibacter sp. OK098]SHM82176.1 CHAD domain-containing protein [Mucilaginibacter sp. OK098]
MKKREERKYFDKEWKGMKSSLIAFFKKEDQEDLHRFRVQVKKLRAFLILSDSAGHQPSLALYFKPVKKIFKEAGEIRNAFMNQELAKEYQTGNNAFISSQCQLQIDATSKFKSMRVKYLKKIKDTHETIKGEIRAISDVHISLFYQNVLQQISGTLTNLKFNEELHDCRKQVKNLMYNHKLIRSGLAIGFNINYMHQVQTVIGDWHDNALAIELYQGDKAMVTGLKKQGAKLKRNITSLTKDFFNQATTVVDLPVEQLS